MTKYMLSVHSVAGGTREPMTAEQMQQMGEQIGILEQEMKSTGAWYSRADCTNRTPRSWRQAWPYSSRECCS